MSKFYRNYKQASKLKMKSAGEYKERYPEEASLNTDAQKNKNDVEQAKK